MKVDFRHMEAEMDDLAANMAAISASSARVSAALQDRHRRGAQLAGTERVHPSTDPGRFIGMNHVGHI